MLVLYHPKWVGRMTVIAIAEDGLQNMVHWSTPPVRAPLPRVNSIVMRLTGSPGDRLARMQSGS